MSATASSDVSRDNVAMRRQTQKRPWQRAIGISSEHFGLITREQLLACRVSESAIARKLRMGELALVYRSVYRVSAAPQTWHQSALAPCLRRPGSVWLYARTAGHFWDLDGCGINPIEVVTECHLRSWGPVEVHQTREMPSRDVTIVANMPVTTVHRTLVDLGTVAHPDIVETALECALRRRITSVERLWRAINAVGTRGRRGAAVLSALLRAHDGRPTESALETRFAQFVRRFRLPAPSRQVRVRDKQGLSARVDFFWDQKSVVVEVDSRSHHLRRRQWEADLRRRNTLTSRGLLVLHVTHERLVTDPDGIALEIRMALQRTQ
jgi:very-short-patch-repair endonuclease